MGVPRRDKGFYFLLEELRCLPAAELSTLELVQQKLSTIRENPHLLTEFWQEARTVRSLEQHFQELIEVYAGCGN